MVSWPAPSAVRSTWISVRDLFGASLRMSIVPVTSPAGVDNVIEPVADRDLSLACAARPPTAAMYRSMTCSAVCADAPRTPARITAATSTRLDIALIDPPFPSLCGHPEQRVARNVRRHFMPAFELAECDIVAAAPEIRHDRAAAAIDRQNLVGRPVRDED